MTRWGREWSAVLPGIRHGSLTLLAAVMPLLMMFGSIEAKECDKIVVSADPDYPPFHWYDAQGWHGASIVIVTRLLTDLNIPYEFKYAGPWARVMAEARSGRMDMLATLKKNAERERFLEFTAIPAFSNPVAVFTRRAETFPFQRWDDLEGKAGVIVRGNRFGERFDAFMASRLRVDTANDIAQAFDMLLHRRVQYVLTGLYPGQAVISASSQYKEIVVLDTWVTDSKNYLAFTKGSACLGYKAAIERRLAELVESGWVAEALRAANRDWAASARR